MHSCSHAMTHMHIREEYKGTIHKPSDASRMWVLIVEVQDLCQAQIMLAFADGNRSVSLQDSLQHVLWYAGLVVGLVSCPAHEMSAAD